MTLCKDWHEGCDFTWLSVCLCSVAHRVQLCKPMHCSPPGSSVHGILQAKILEWVATFLISSASVRSISFLSFIVPIFAWNVPLVPSNFLEEISSLSHSIFFPVYFFTLITEEGFISPCYSFGLCIQMDISCLFSFAFSLFFCQLFVRPPQTTILPFCISFSWGWSW